MPCGPAKRCSPPYRRSTSASTQRPAAAPRDAATPARPCRTPRRPATRTPRRREPPTPRHATRPVAADVTTDPAPACRQALRQPAAACSSTIFRSVERGVIVMTGGHVDSHSSRSATEASPVGGYGVRGHGGSPPPSGPDGRAARRAVASTAGSGRPRHGRVARGWPEVSSTATSASSNAQKSSTGGCRRPAPVGMTPMPGTGRRRQRAPHPGSDIPQFTRPDAGRIHRR